LMSGKVGKRPVLRAGLRVLFLLSNSVRFGIAILPGKRKRGFGLDGHLWHEK
jgi:hypothetical protein